MDGILFIARLGSTRLSQKHLIKARNLTFIEWLVKRFEHFFAEAIERKEIKLIIATADEPGNRRFDDILRKHQVEVFYGSPDNIPLRLLESAEHFGFNNIISVDGDDILCSPRAASAVWHQLKAGTATYAKTTGLPLGMNVMGMNIQVLRDALRDCDKSLLETGWGRIFEKHDAHLVKLGDHDSDQLRFTLDYEEDAVFFRTVIESLGDKVISASDEEIIDLVMRKELQKINNHLNNQYWLNFNNQISKEERLP